MARHILRTLAVLRCLCTSSLPNLIGVPQRSPRYVIEQQFCVVQPICDAFCSSELYAGFAPPIEDHEGSDVGGVFHETTSNFLDSSICRFIGEWRF